MTNHKTTRREVLAGFGGGLISLGSVSGVKATDVNKQTFVRALPHFELLDRIPSRWNLAVTAVDLPRTLYKDGSEVYIPEQADSVLEDGNIAMQKPGSKPSRELTIGGNVGVQLISGTHGPSLRPVSLIRTKESVTIPEVDISVDGRTAKVHGRTAKVAAGNTKSFEQDSKQIRIKVTRTTSGTHTIPDDIPDDMPVRPASKSETKYTSVRVKPKVIVKNFGELRVKKMPITP